MSLTAGTGLGPYEVVGVIGAGGPAFVRGGVDASELRRGLAEANERTR